MSFAFGAQIVNLPISFISSIITTRILGSVGRGENAIFTNATAFAVLLFGFSISSTIPYFVNSGKAKPGKLLTTIIVFILGSTTLVFLTLSVLDAMGKLGLALPNSIQSLQYKLIFVGLYFTTLLYSVITTYLSAYKKFKEVSIYGIAYQCLTLGVYLMLFYNVIPYDHANPFKTFTIVTALLSLVSIIGVCILFVKLLDIKPERSLLPFALVKQFILFSIFAYLANFFQFIVYKLDFWVVDAYAGKANLGVYSLATQLSQMLWILPQTVASVLYAYASSTTEKEAITHTIQIKQVVFVLTLLFALIGLTLSYFLIPVLYGNDFLQAFNLMLIFMIGIIPFCFITITSGFFAARGAFKINLTISFVMSLLSCLLYFILIPRFGITGGAIASSVTYLLSAIICETVFSKKYNSPVSNLFKIDKGVFSFSAIKKIFKN